MRGQASKNVESLRDEYLRRRIGAGQNTGQADFTVWQMQQQKNESRRLTLNF
jgi:hypothetical protein